MDFSGPHFEAAKLSKKTEQRGESGEREGRRAKMIKKQTIRKWEDQRAYCLILDEQRLLLSKEQTHQRESKSRAPLRVSFGCSEGVKEKEVCSVLPASQ